VKLAWRKRNPTVGLCYHRTQQREVRASRMHVEREMLNKSVLEREHLSLSYSNRHIHRRPIIDTCRNLGMSQSNLSRNF
jgi:hypothetical protein